MYEQRSYQYGKKITNKEIIEEYSESRVIHYIVSKYDNCEVSIIQLLNNKWEILIHDTKPDSLYIIIYRMDNIAHGLFYTRENNIHYEGYHNNGYIDGWVYKYKDNILIDKRYYMYGVIRQNKN